jgi:hypothetical protein
VVSTSAPLKKRAIEREVWLSCSGNSPQLTTPSMGQDAALQKPLAYKARNNDAKRRLGMWMSVWRRYRVLRFSSPANRE